MSPAARGNLESASSRSCADALGALDLPTGSVTSVEVWGGNGQARLPGGVLFLAQFSDGWKITAAGCTFRGSSQPYDCDVKG